MKRFLLSSIILAVVILSFVIGWTLYQSRARLPILSTGTQTGDVMLNDQYAYQQRDPQWRSIHLGHNQTAGTLGEVGCTVSSIAVALSNLGIEVTPQELNQNMVDHGGFNDRGWLIWKAIADATDNKATAIAFSSPSHEQIDACLQNNQYPIVKYLIGGVVQHWVTIVGKQNGEYLIRDPLIKGDRPEILSTHTPQILSVRCIGLNL